MWLCELLGKLCGHTNAPMTATSYGLSSSAPKHLKGAERAKVVRPFHASLVHVAWLSLSTEKSSVMLAGSFEWTRCDDARTCCCPKAWEPARAKASATVVVSFMAIVAVPGKAGQRLPCSFMGVCGDKVYCDCSSCLER